MDFDYLQLSLSSIDLVQKIVVSGNGSEIRLNALQCQYLAGELLETRRFLQECKGNFELVHAKVRVAFLHIYNVLKRAEILVVSCCQQSSWLEGAMKLADIKEDIIDILLELQIGTTMVKIGKEFAKTGAISLAIESQLLKSEEERFQNLSNRFRSNSFLLDAAAKDKNNLLKKLQEVQETCSGRQKNKFDYSQYTLAVYLQSRWGSEAGGGIDSEKTIHRNSFLNKFHNSKPIGHGSFGSVLEVTWLGRRCALKICRQSTKEAAELRRHHHPHVVRFFRYWEAPYGAPDSGHRLESHIMMELMACDLSNKIEREKVRQRSPSNSSGGSPSMPFALPVAIDTMLQVAKAMRHLHDNKMTHRDLKPTNVLVSRVPEINPALHDQGYLHVRLGDFGLCKSCDASSTFNVTPRTGTPVYSAPEIFCQEQVSITKYPKEADIWSFAMTASEILTGEAPFKDEHRSSLHARILKDRNLRPTLSNECPEYLRFCITSCWEQDPKDRPGFHDVCRMLRCAKLLSLGIIRLESCYDTFSYTTREGVRKQMRPPATVATVNHDLPPVYKQASTTTSNLSPCSLDETEWQRVADALTHFSMGSYQWFVDLWSSLAMMECYCRSNQHI